MNGASALHVSGILLALVVVTELVCRLTVAQWLVLIFLHSK